jgi:hypothetical protein
VRVWRASLLGFMAAIAVTASIPATSKSNRPAPAPTKLRDIPHSNSGNRAEEPKPDKRGTDELPFSVKVLPSEKSADEAAKEQYEAREKPALDRGLTFYTGVLAALTGALWAAALIQVGLFWWQLRLIRASLEDAKIAADAAKEAADAARDSFNLSKITAERQLQSYISIESICAVGLGEMGAKQIGIKGRIKNFGQTPAYKFRMCFGACLRDFPIAEEKLDLPPPQGDGPLTSISQVPPGGGVEIMLDYPLSLNEDQFKRLGNQTLAIYFFGEIRYVDIFKQRRTEKFRMMIGGNAGVRLYQKDGETRCFIGSCDSGNDSLIEPANN